MKRATLERLAAVLVLAACICAECIPLLLALVDNLGQVQWTYADPDGTARTGSMTLEEAEADLPGWVTEYNACFDTDWSVPEHLKDYAASPARRQQLLSMADFGFPQLLGEDSLSFPARLPD